MADPLRALLIKHEGFKQVPYLDCCGKPWRECVCENKGKLTIGVGRNLDDVGMSLGEIELLLNNDTVKARSALLTAYPWFFKISETRRNVVIDMMFNLGPGRFAEFKKLHAAIQAGDFEAAASEMLSSKWAGQVGKRAVELAEMMRDGDLQLT